MIDPRFLKNLPAPVRTLIRPILFISLGLHGLLLNLPIPSQPPELPPPTEPVKVTQLTPPPSPQPSPSLGFPKPSPRLQQSTPPLIKPSPWLRQSTPLVVKPSPTIQQPEPFPTMEQGTPSPAPPSPVASPTPIPSETTTSSETPTPPPAPPEEPSPSPDELFADFPHSEGAEASCNGLLDCWQVENALTSVSGELQENLIAQGYEVKKLDIEDDTGRRVFKVFKKGETPYYLNLLSTLEGTVYRITKEPLTREELAKQAAS
ncbi:MAG: hypothetical protein LDL41_00070 [Coleofasciculus sp. S288]|nr:hypothetical protein [Coleofasciculus sp. S288]